MALQLTNEQLERITTACATGFANAQARGGKLSNMRRLESIEADAWAVWRNQLERYLAHMTGWTNNKKKAEAFTLLGEEPASMVSDINLTNEDQTVEDVLTLWEARYNTQAAGRAARDAFRTARQLPDETVQAYAVRIRRLFVRAFPDERAVDTNRTLRERFTDGLLDVATGDALADQDPATFTRCWEFAQARTIRTQNRRKNGNGVHAIQGQEEAGVNAMGSGRGRGGGGYRGKYKWTRGSNDSQRGRGGGRGRYDKKPYGRGGRGGSGSYSNTSTQLCHHCAEEGHYKRDCPVLRRVNDKFGQAAGKGYGVNAMGHAESAETPRTGSGNEYGLPGNY